MRVMVDTNVLFSAILFPDGKAAKALHKCLMFYELVIPSYVVDELKSVIRKKLPEKSADIDLFLSKLSFEFVYTPSEIKEGLFEIRDKKDYPVLYTAIIENVDLLISGDKDFSDTNINHPEILSPRRIYRSFLISRI